MENRSRKKTRCKANMPATRQIVSSQTVDITPDTVQRYARQGMDRVEIAATFGLLLSECIDILNQPEIDKAILIGEILFKADLKKKLLDSSDTGILIMNARRILGSSDTVNKETENSALQSILAKADIDTKAMLLKLLNDR